MDFAFKKKSGHLIELNFRIILFYHVFQLYDQIIWE